MNKILYQSTKDGNLISLADQKLLQVSGSELKSRARGRNNILEVTLESGKGMRIVRKAIDETAFSFGPPATGLNGKAPKKEKLVIIPGGRREGKTSAAKGPRNDVGIPIKVLEQAVEIYLYKIRLAELALQQLKRTVNAIELDLQRPLRYPDTDMKGGTC